MVDSSYRDVGFFQRHANVARGCDIQVRNFGATMKRFIGSQPLTSAFCGVKGRNGSCASRYLREYGSDLVRVR